MDYAPIHVSVYHRLEHFKRCIDALKANPEAQHSVLYISSDAAAKPEHEAIIHQVRQFAEQITGFREVILIKHDRNYGAIEANLRVRRALFERFDRFIRLEDDIVLSPVALRYFNDALSRYESQPNITSICAYSPPMSLPSHDPQNVFLAPQFNAWGFAMWRNQYDTLTEPVTPKRYLDVFPTVRDSWKAVGQVGMDFMLQYQKLVLGHKRHFDMTVSFNQYAKDYVSLFPAQSLARNDGMDGSGVNCVSNTRFDCELSVNPVAFPETKLEPSLTRQLAIAKFFQRDAGLYKKLCFRYAIVSRHWRIQKLATKA